MALEMACSASIVREDQLRTCAFPWTCVRLPQSILKPFCPGSGDLAARERSFIKPDEDGLRMIGFDLDVNGEISHWTEVIVHISPPVP